MNAEAEYGVELVLYEASNPSRKHPSHQIDHPIHTLNTPHQIDQQTLSRPIHTITPTHTPMRRPTWQTPPNLRCYIPCRQTHTKCADFTPLPHVARIDPMPQNQWSPYNPRRPIRSKPPTHALGHDYSPAHPRSKIAT